MSTRKKSVGEKKGRTKEGAEAAAARADLRAATRRVTRIAAILRQHFPESTRYAREVSFVDTLVAIILSQNTSDVNSHRAYQSLRAAWPTWEEVADAAPEEIVPSIRVGGLAEGKARTIHAMLNALREEWGDFALRGIERVEDDPLIERLTAIKGVGLKSASCAMMFALGRDLCAVDTHIHRVINRLGVVRAATPDATFRALRPLIPPGEAHTLHVGLILFGRSICKARYPHCFACPLYKECAWEPKEEFAAGGKEGPKAVSGDFLITEGI